MLEADPYAIQKVEAAEAAKSPKRRLAEETFWFSCNFLIGVGMLWLIADAPNLFTWLAASAFGPVTKGMLLGGLYVLLVSFRLIAFAVGPRK